MIGTFGQIVKFQSTLPRGSDSEALKLARAYKNFNPRSLAGATVFNELSEVKKYNFNPRSLAGATILSSCHLIVSLFQSTLPRGSDRYFHPPSMRRLYFNPRSLAGATEKADEVVQSYTPFQSTLPRGSDAKLSSHFSLMRISIHAPSRERPYNKLVVNYFLHFNPRSLAGATFVKPFKSKSGIFQSTLPRGSDSGVTNRVTPTS